MATEEDLSKVVLEPEWQLRFTRLMMISVSQRYALLFELRLVPEVIEKTSLVDSPAKCTSSLVTALFLYGRKAHDMDKAIEEIKTFLALVMTAPLPEGIPDIN